MFECRLRLRPNDGAGTTKLSQVGLIDRYLARSIAVPLIGSLILAAMLLILDKMLRLFQYVVDAGGPVSVVWRMLANLLPEYLSLGIPIGLMLGILLAFRKLALSSELDALRGIGIGYGRLLRIPFAYAIPLAIINLFIVGYLEPYTHYRYEGLRFDLKSGALGAAIKVGEFNRLGKHLTLRIDSSENKGTQLHGIFVQMDQGQGKSVAATAEGGRFLSSDNADTILFRMTKGRLVQDSPKFPTPRTLAFDLYTLPISLPMIDQFRSRGANESDELYLHELWRLGYGGGATNPKQRIQAQAHFNFRMVEVVMMLLLPFLAIALAVPPKRSTSALGIFISILIVVAYHKVNQYAEAAGANGQVNPAVALWVPFVLIAALILWMYHILAHRPGGQPIGALEWFFAKTAKYVRRTARAMPRPRAAASAAP
jgi:lipopolysaccharide export system permease protein